MCQQGLLCLTKAPRAMETWSIAGDCRRGQRSMPLLFACCCCLLLLCLTQTAIASQLPDLSRIPTPPTFIHEANPNIMYFVLDSAMLEESSSTINLKERRFLCKASGYPSVSYRWLKDGVPLNFEELNDRATSVPGEGTFILSKLRLEDEGIYQCIAENGNGSAYDREIVLRRTFMSYFPKSEPEIIDVELGDPLEKSCVPPPSVPPARVFWIFKGDDGSKFQTINSSFFSKNSEKYLVHEIYVQHLYSVSSVHCPIIFQGTIFIQYANYTDQLKVNMYFTCTAENTELKDYKFGNQFRMNILKNKRKSIRHVAPTEQYISPSVTIALRGRSFKLFCIYAGYPDLMPEWRKVNGVIDPRRVNWGTDFKKSLLIQDVDFHDEGDYECFFPSMPELSRRLKVNVHAAPYWVEGPPPSQNSSEGESVEFRCNARGKPTPNITFYKNGHKIVPDDRYSIDGEVLTIQNLRKAPDGAGDNAVYQCKAENAYGYVWANFYLNILSFPAVILEGPGNREAVVGQRSVHKCRVFGSPKPKIEWRSPVLTGALYRYTPLNAEGISELVLYEVDKKHEASFECHASNKYGEASEIGSLVVRDPTRLFQYPSNTTVTAGNSIQLPCKAYHDNLLKVKYTWLIDGIPLGNLQPHIKVDENYTLIIENPKASDSADYTCVAETKLDKAERVATILVKDVPLPPFFVGVTCSERNAAVRFQHRDRPRTAAPVESFWVQYNSNDAEPDAWHIYPVPVTTRADKDWWTITVPLHPWGNFSFRAVARNEVGDSAPSLASTQCTTAAALPELNPANVVVRGTSPDNLVVSWDPVERVDWNGPDFHYVVEMKRADDDDSRWETAIVTDPNESQLVVPDQPTYEPYDVRVQSANSLGKATVSPATVRGYSGEGYPDEAPKNFRLVNVVAPTVATFAWDPVDPASLHGNFKGYKIVHWHETGKRSDPVKKESLFDSSASQGTVYDLKPFRVNYAEVYAANDAYDSPPSQRIRFDMPEGVPSQVQSLSAFPLSHREIGVIWKPPREYNGHLIGYNLSYCLLSESKSGASFADGSCMYRMYDVDVNHERIHGLKAESEYRVEMRGVTNAGLGDPSSVDVKTIPEDINKVNLKLLVQVVQMRRFDVIGMLFLVIGDAIENESVMSPSQPSLAELGVGENQINISWIPGSYDAANPTPVGDKFFFKYRMKGTDQWEEAFPDGNNFSVTLDDLYPGTVYEVKSVSVVETEQGGLETESPVYYMSTLGRGNGSLAAWLIAVLVAILFLIFILLAIFFVVRCRGAKYPVSAKEKEQGREPMLKDDKGFGEYTYPDSMTDDRRSLAGGSKGESETDSMAEYGDGETGRFTEDGSFIGQYGNPKYIGGGLTDRTNPNLSTFV
ncbi:Neuroglian [Trichinella murrelli]|uniref:Neuroglian n=1 Tax=Trichinella murrelli TaxID=144512 RepID=A0A0V0UEB0_9BILA|nr:Neuroglian [Trichinella murrelli]